jgi:HAD superfamily hydrolase (TIGR01509 family)
VVFDFDGLIVDTEWSIYEMAAATFAQFDVDLPVPVWATIVGLADESDWWGRLCDANGWQVDRDEWWRRYRAIDRSSRDRLPALPGVTELLDDLEAGGIPRGIASSSSRDWVEGHLGRLGLLERFDTVAGVDRSGVGKPAPDVYVIACEDLGAAPARSVAIEDSSHGIAAAKSAGMACVAVPSRITRHTDLSAADLTVASLADVAVGDLAALVPVDSAG